MKLQAIAALSIIGFAGLSACTSQKAETTEPKVADKTASSESVTKTFEPAPKAYKAPINDWATKPYTRDQFPKTFAKFGSRMSDLQAYRVKAANVVSQNQACDEVIQSEISTMRGSVSNMNFWVDCENGKRFRFTESELDGANVVALSEDQKAIDSLTARKYCKQLIYQAANNPSTVEFNPLPGGYTMIPATGNVAYGMMFSAKNAFGTKLKFEARCIFTTDGKGEASIKERQS